MNPEPTEPAMADRLARALVLLRRGRRYVLGGAVVFAIGLAVAVLFTLNVRRTYLSECTFAVRAPDKPGALESESSAKRAARIKDMVHERARLENAIHKFKLYPGLVESAGMLDAVEAMKPHVGIRARESGRYVVSFDMSETPGVDVRDVVRDVTQYLAESIAEDFVGGSIGELKNDALFLGKEVNTASAEIDTAVKAVSTFLSRHPEFAVPASSGLSGTPKKAADPVDTGDPVLAALYRQKARLEADLAATSKTAVPAAPAAPSNTETRDRAVAALDAATKAYAVAQADVVAKSAKLTPEHPDMKSAQATLAAALAHMQEARARLAAIDANKPSGVVDAGASPASDSQADKLKQITALIAAREAVLAKGGAAVPVATSPQLDVETEWQRLLRDLGEAKKRYDEVRGKSEATQLALKAADANKAGLIAIIEPAFRPTKPSKGRRGLTAVLGGLSACAFALLYVLARVLLEDQVADAGDIDALGLAPALGTLAHVAPGGAIAEAALARSVPATALAGRRPPAQFPFEGRPIKTEMVMPEPTAPAILAVLSDDPKPIAALRLMRHRLELLRDEGRRMFAVTSSRDGEGKSTLAAQLALVLSESQRARVALVEAGLHRPSLARLLGFAIPEGCGLSAQAVRAMRGGHEPWTLLALGPSLHVLAESEEQPRFPRALHSAQFRDLLTMLNEVYDYVIIDAPSVLEGGEANALEPIVDGMLLVSRAGFSKKSELRRALRQLGARKTVGVVLIGGAGEIA